MRLTSFPGYWSPFFWSNFCIGCCNSISLREDFVPTATLAQEPDGMVMQPSELLVLFMGHTVTHFCCNLLLQTLECYPKCSHVRLACFVFETNQHFVGSACIAGLWFNSPTDEINKELCFGESLTLSLRMPRTILYLPVMSKNVCLHL